ncbi:hypothetical protein AB0C45_03790 [Streptomyces cyaneofuscatus]|uniref:hypothetical protein n=1 Tax=Streptomyces cyaneofuscatus TaxID=66883 RepID=UPI0033D54003
MIFAESIRHTEECTLNYRSVSAVAAGLVLALAPASSAFAAGDVIQINSATAGSRPFMNPIEVEVTYSCAPGLSATIFVSAGSDTTTGSGSEAAQCNGRSMTTTLEVKPILGPDNMVGSFSQGDKIEVDGAIVGEVSAERPNGSIARTEGTLTVQ